MEGDRAEGSQSAREAHTTDEKKRSDQIQPFETQKIRTAWDAEQEEWVHPRLLATRGRAEFTNEWQKRDVEGGREYTILTDEISKVRI